ncbi:MAG: integrase [Sulfitobacter sp.]|jgi:integrase
MRYNAKTGYWVDENGCRFVRNEFDPDAPVFITVSQDEWAGWRLNREHRLIWPPEIHQSLKLAIEKILIRRMRRASPSSLSPIKHAVKSIVSAQTSEQPITATDLLDLRIVRHIWDCTIPSHRPWLRKLIIDIAEMIDPLEGASVAIILESWKAKRQIKWRKSVLEWEPDQGALTSAELEMLRRELLPSKTETASEHYARIFVRLTLLTLRRPSQLILMKADAIRRIATDVGMSTDIFIPMGKDQAHHEGRWNSIPNDLADDIENYRDRSVVRKSAVVDDFLLPIVSYEGTIRERVFAPYGALAKGRVRSWVKNLELISPRTGRPLNLNFRRLRHTGATHLAMQGYSIEVIAEVLEHEAVSSSRYYIDAIGAEFLPVFERVDRNLGGRFSMMNAAWFKGKVVDRSENTDRPIIVPDILAPTVVGACGKGSGCPVHPLFSCYSCEQFLAFRDADHQKVLDFVEGEYKRWRAAETSNSRSKVIKDFDRVAAGVREVLIEIRKS